MTTAMHLLIRTASVLLALAATAKSSAGQTPVVYDVAFPNAEHHEAHVTATFMGLDGAPLRLRMSRASPGRYALHEFAKDVYSVEARGPHGEPLAVARSDPYGWNVPDHGASVTVSYTLYGDHADGTYVGIDRTHAHLNMPAAFMFVPALQDRPIRVTFHPRDGWTVATQLQPVAGTANTYFAPDLQYFMDSPTEISDHRVRSWAVESGGRRETLRIAMHHLGTSAQLDRFVDGAKRIVATEMAVYGELPRYDYDSYTFIADYLPWVFGDGMEHRNSTILTSTRSLADAEAALLHTLAHEFFHSWNMERIRAKEIEPFDFLHADPSPELWFGEGFTNFYDGLAMKRAGLASLDDFTAEEGRAINTVVNMPGRRYHSAAGMSLLAPFVDAATSIDATNFSNTFISYYTWGEAIAIGLDLTLRTRFQRSLDDYMRAMWRKYGETAEPYGMDDLRATLAEVAGDSAFAGDFFRRYITGHDVMDYTALLDQAGLLLRRAAPDRAWLGYFSLAYSDSGATLTSNTLVGQPLFEAGLDNGDRILRVDGTPATDDAVLERVLGRHAPGDVVSIDVVNRAGHGSARVTLAADPTLELLSYENVGRTPTPAMRRLREEWLGTPQQRH